MDAPPAEMRSNASVAALEEDCKVLYNAIKGIGTNTDDLIQVLCRRDHPTIMRIREMYLKKYRHDLAEHIADDTSFDFKRIMAGLAMPRVDYLATELHSCLDGLGTEEGGLMDCLAFASNREIMGVKRTFQDRYKKSLEERISDDTSGNFKRLCLRLLSCRRDEGAAVSHETADRLAVLLYEKGEGKFGTDTDFFLETFTTLSWEMVREVDSCYMERYKKSLWEAAKAETSGDLLKGLKALVGPKEKWWVRRFNKAVAGLGTNDRLLVRGLVLNNRHELRHINELYRETYHKSLVDAISSDTSGTYKRACLALFD